MFITALYAALLAPLFILLSARVIGRRGDAKVSLGAGEDDALLRRMRVQANFAEYVPFALICMALAENLAAPALALHAIGLTLLLGRCAHAYGFSQTPDNMVLRIAGMVGTFTAISGAALACLVLSVGRL